jgi:hypothetical protein
VMINFSFLFITAEVMDRERFSSKLILISTSKVKI